MPHRRSITSLQTRNSLRLIYHSVDREAKFKYIVITVPRPRLCPVAHLGFCDSGLAADFRAHQHIDLCDSEPLH
eukprot:971748-Alexandrium_andersonii.AAC.1